MSDPRHHQRLRKSAIGLDARALKTTRLKYVMDHLVYLAGFLIPIMTIPQLATLYIHHDGQSLSTITWGSYFIGSCFWFFYGLVHKERPIMFINFVTAVIQGIIVVGIFLYR